MDRAYQQEWKAPPREHGIPRDPTLLSAAERHNLATPIRILKGRIVDAVAYTGWFRVLLEQGKTPTPCVMLTQTAMLPYGARQMGGLSYGATVWVLDHPQSDYGVIVGVEPPPATDPRLQLNDYWFQGSRVGLRIDHYHHSLLDLPRAGTITDWSAGRPVDSLPVGEWGAITETGLRVLLDSYMAQLAVDEATGVFAFYHDQLLRIAGVNLEERGSGHERVAYNDQEELHGILGNAVYPWEQLGMIDRARPFRDESPERVQLDPACYAPLEPIHDDQIPFHRRQIFEGYLGQGGKEFVKTRPPGGIYRLNSRTDGRCLFTEQTMLTGRHVLDSATGITLVKRPALAIPRKIKQPNDKTGDKEDNYRFSGILGDGEPHKIRQEPRPVDGKIHMQMLLGIRDWHAHLLNWDTIHPFHYHKLDWFVPEDAEISTLSPLDFGPLKQGAWMNLASQEVVPIDHRYGQARIFKSESKISLLPDGGIVLADGYGASLVLTGGEARLTAPGGVWLQSGMNVNLLAGHDIIGRAKYSVDLTGTKKDIRLAAGKNMQLLAGRDEEPGGILLETKGQALYAYKDRVGEDVGMGGIHLKSAKGAVVTWAKDIYLRTGGGDVQQGQINFDANDGFIIEKAQSCLRFVAVAVADYFSPGDAESPVIKCNVWSATGNIVAAATCICGSIVVDGHSVFRGWVSTVGGHFASELAETYKGLVAVLDDSGAARSLSAAIASVDDCQEAEKAESDKGTATKIATYPNGWYLPGNAGNEEVITSAHFTFRNMIQYATAGILIPETTWQQYARLAGAGLVNWVEPPLADAPDAGKYPFPGKDKIDKEIFLTQDLLLDDWAGGHYVDRGAIYHDPKYEPLIPHVLNDAYMVLT